VKRSSSAQKAPSCSDKAEQRTTKAKLVISEFCLSSNPQEVSCSSAQLSELSSEILHAGLSLRLVGKGGSMRPMVREGDLLEIQPVDPSSIHRGDIVLCLLEDGRVVIHRVVRIDRRAAGLRFLVQGDQAWNRMDGSGHTRSWGAWLNSNGMASAFPCRMHPPACLASWQLCACNGS